MSIVDIMSSLGRLVHNVHITDSATATAEVPDPLAMLARLKQLDVTMLVWVEPPNDRVTFWHTDGVMSDTVTVPSAWLTKILEDKRAAERHLSRTMQ